jgi:asparagine synthase (glutamine-hydrolysing)
MAGSYLDLQARLAHDLATSLAVLLRYEDRNSMAFSVEARVPFLDYRLVEFAFSVPYIYKIHEGWSKWLLRQAMEGVMPESVRLRKDKLGFPTPQLHWLRQNRDNIMGLFSDQGFKAARHIDNRYIVAHLDRLLVDESSAADLWRFINLEFWMRAFEL